MAANELLFNSNPSSASQSPVDINNANSHSQKINSEVELPSFELNQLACEHDDDEKMEILKDPNDLKTSSFSKQLFKFNNNADMSLCHRHQSEEAQHQQQPGSVDVEPKENLDFDPELASTQRGYGYCSLIFIILTIIICLRYSSQDSSKTSSIEKKYDYSVYNGSDINTYTNVDWKQALALYNDNSDRSMQHCMCGPEIATLLNNITLDNTTIIYTPFCNFTELVLTSKNPTSYPTMSIYRMPTGSPQWMITPPPTASKPATSSSPSAASTTADASTTKANNTDVPTTKTPTTKTSTTSAPITPAPVTPVPTTKTPTTKTPTTPAPDTPAPTTKIPTTSQPVPTRNPLF